MMKRLEDYRAASSVIDGRDNDAMLAFPNGVLVEQRVGLKQGGQRSLPIWGAKISEERKSLLKNGSVEF